MALTFLGSLAALVTTGLSRVLAALAARLVTHVLVPAPVLVSLVLGVLSTLVTTFILASLITLALIFPVIASILCVCHS